MNFLENDVFQWNRLLEMICKFCFNTLVITYLIRFLYYPKTKRRDFLFTYYIISTTIFLICILLVKVKLELGFALGLFAIFGIIRYRTMQMPIKEMTYLFLVIGISIINALTSNTESYIELVFANIVMVVLVTILEKVHFLRHQNSKIINYGNIELTKPQNRILLISDLEANTGLKIHKVEVGKIDLLKKTARLIVYYYEEHNHINTADSIESTKDDDE